MEKPDAFSLPRRILVQPAANLLRNDKFKPLDHGDQV
jgi:hypothetical protein